MALSNFSILVAATLLIFVSNNTCQDFSQLHQEPPLARTQTLQVHRDEFNTTEQIPEEIFNSTYTRDYPLMGLKLILLRDSHQNCCLSWSNLIQQRELQDDLRRRFGRGRQILKSPELLHELEITFLNITYLSLDGQPGENEREKYYSFFDGVLYYQRLIKVARGYLEGIKTTTTTLPANQVEFNRYFERQLNSIEFRVSQDPAIRSFLSELMQDSSKVAEINENFKLYENFLGHTEFGQYYARNVSMIRESVSIFDQIYSHLTSLDFPNNFTKPSRQYKIIRKLSHELYTIRNQIVQQISVRVRQNRDDARGMFRKLKELSETRPYIRLLGDEFSLIPPNFGANVKQLTRLLDLYLFNNLTHLSFYDQLTNLPQDFVILGSNIAHFYENKEIMHLDRFDFEYYNEPKSSLTSGYNTTSRSWPQNNATVTSTIAGIMSSIFGI